MTVEKTWLAICRGESGLLDLASERF